MSRPAGRLGLLSAVALLAIAVAPAVWAGDPHAGTSPGGFDPSSFTVLWMQRSHEVAQAMQALESGDLERAIVESEAALLLSLARVDRLAALNVLCVAHVDRGTASLGLPRCSELVAETRGDWRALNNRGNARLAVEDFDGAIADYERALEAVAALPLPPTVRNPVTGQLASARDTLRANLEIARRHVSRTLQYVRAPGEAPRP